jgi:hypothetical protein
MLMPAVGVHSSSGRMGMGAISNYTGGGGDFGSSREMTTSNTTTTSARIPKNITPDQLEMPC